MMRFRPSNSYLSIALARLEFAGEPRQAGSGFESNIEEAKQLAEELPEVKTYRNSVAALAAHRQYLADAQAELATLRDNFASVDAAEAVDMSLAISQHERDVTTLNESIAKLIEQTSNLHAEAANAISRMEAKYKQTMLEAAGKEYEAAVDGVIPQMEQLVDRLCKAQTARRETVLFALNTASRVIGSGPQLGQNPTPAVEMIRPLEPAVA